MHEVVVSFAHVGTQYGHTHALTDTSFTICRGEYVVVAGPNGSGKSTLLRSMLGILPFSGEIRLFGEPVGHFQHWDRIGYVPQKLYAFNPLFPASVEEIVRLGLLSAKKFPKRFTPTDAHLVDDILKKMEIYELRHESIQDLSGGQQQKVFIARALVGSPQLLLLDEPTSSLDSAARINFFALLRHLNQEHQVSIVFVSHDIGDIGQDASRLLYLENKLIYDGSLTNFCLPGKATHGSAHETHQHLFHQHLHPENHA